jgi:ParB/RepB/Spo0J family partition protein
MEPSRLGFIDPNGIDFGKRFRENYEIDDEFLDSIREKGIITPITVTQQGTMRPRLVSGGRRLTAALTLKLQQIPVLYRDCEDELDLRECELFENLHRKNLRWDEDVLLVARIHELMFQKFGVKWNQRKTADLIDRSVGLISRKLELARSIEKIPALRSELTEDACVKKLRKMVETLVVKDLVARHATQAEGAGASLDSESDKDTEGTTQVQTDIQSDPRLETAIHAKSHYRVGDALEGMNEMIRKGLKPPITLIEVDPPYGINLQGQKKGETTRELSRYEEVESELYPGFINKLCRTLYDVSPPNCRVVFWFGQEWYSLVRKNLEDAGFSVDPIPCIWIKPSGQTNNPEKFLARCYESFFVATKGEGVPLQKRGRRNVFEFNAVPAARKYHPTQRPIELMVEILNTFAWPGSIILSPFLGSGTTLRAAYRVGMTGWGWDTNAENYPKFIAAVQEDVEEFYMKKTKANGGDPQEPPNDDAEPSDPVYEDDSFGQDTDDDLEDDDDLGVFCTGCGYDEDNCECDDGFKPDMES